MIIMEMALYQCGLMIAKVNEIHIMYHENKPTRAGSYTKLPLKNSFNKACIEKIKMINVCNMLFRVVFMKDV